LYHLLHNAAGRNGFQGGKTMVDISKLGQTILATVGAMVLTATAVGAAVGPARAIETAPISLVAAPVSGQALVQPAGGGSGGFAPLPSQAAASIQCVRSD
jgi:hypothetical protein